MLKKAFTLIELLIVIAILGILAVGLLIALDPIEQTRRATDTSVLQSSGDIKDGINRYYAGHLYYPWCTASGTCTYIAGCADGASLMTGATCGKTVLDAIVTAGELKSTPPSTIASKIYLVLSATGVTYQVSFVPSSKSFKTNYASSVGAPGIYNTTAATCATAAVGDLTTCPVTSATCQYCIF